MDKPRIDKYYNEFNDCVKVTYTVFDGKRRVYHREDGPALSTYSIADGRPISMEWYINGDRHRLDGPAIAAYSGNDRAETIWFQGGAIHREDGPAYIYANGDISHYLSGQWISPEMYADLIELGKRIKQDTNLAILHLRHRYCYISYLCQEMVNGKD